MFKLRQVGTGLSTCSDRSPSGDYNPKSIHFKADQIYLELGANTISWDGLWEELGLKEVLALEESRPRREELLVYSNAPCSNLPCPFLPFLPISTPPSWHTGPRRHVACHVCTHWVVTLSFSPNKSVLVTKHLVDILFQLTRPTERRFSDYF